MSLKYLFGVKGYLKQRYCTTTHLLVKNWRESVKAGTPLDPQSFISFIGFQNSKFMVIQQWLTGNSVSGHQCPILTQLQCFSMVTIFIVHSLFNSDFCFCFIYVKTFFFIFCSLLLWSVDAIWCFFFFFSSSNFSGSVRACASCWGGWCYWNQAT